MKRLMFLFLGLLPMTVVAQFSGRIHSLEPQFGTSLNLKLEKVINTTLQKQIKNTESQNVLLKRTLDTFSTLNGISIDIKPLMESYLRNVGEEYVKVLNDSLVGKQITEAINEAINISTKRDSFKAEYLKLVGKKVTDTVGSIAAHNYRNKMDSVIIQNFYYNKKFYHILKPKLFKRKEPTKGKKEVSAMDSLKNSKISNNEPKLYVYKSDSLFKRSKYKRVRDTVVTLFSYFRHQDTVKEDSTILKDVADTESKLNNIETTNNLYRGAREYFDFLNRSENNPLKRPWWLPLKSISHAEYFYFGDGGERIKLLTNIGVQSNFYTNATVNTEILSGILPLEMRYNRKNPKKRLALPLKFDLGITISKEAVDTMTNAERKDISSLIYGGLLHARLSYPIFYANWKYHNGKGIRTYIPVTTTFNWESKAGDSQVLSQLYYFGELATNIYMEIDLIQGANAKADAAIFLNTKMAYLDGGSEFYNKHIAKREGVWLCQFNGGIRVKDRYSIAVNIPIWASDENILQGRKTPSIAILIDPNF